MPDDGPEVDLYGAGLLGGALSPKRTGNLAEEWRIIKGFPDYAVSNHGRVRRETVAKVHNTYPGRILKQRLRKEGYFSVSVSNIKTRKSKSFLVHVLVALEFIGDRPTPDHQVAHWDGDEGNNFVDNLRWATPEENRKDMERHGTKVFGLIAWNKRITDDQVREIRKLRTTGLTYDNIADLYNISGAFAYRLCVFQRRGNVL